jgi:hypothetical protein
MRSSFAAMAIEHSEDCAQHLLSVVRHVGPVPSVFGNDFWMGRDRIAEGEAKVEIVIFATAQPFVEAAKGEKDVTAI